MTDVSTAESPNQIDVKVSKTVINYDIDNNITDQSTTVTEGQSTLPPAENDQDIDFDDMEDNELEEYELPDMENYSSWGSGTCPAPIDINTTHWQGQIDTAPICEYAEGLKPFVLLLAALSSAFIISGTRQSGGD
ncbi:MAG: hypothetical protein H0V39_06180 [Nitrosomonas sp.]|nr:hypothetical protein [Nitrosomonas sp.]